MKKTISLALISLLILSLSAMATEYPVVYPDKSCQEDWVYHTGFPHWRWEEVCTDEERDTSVDVPETDLTTVYEQLTTLENRGDNTGWSGNDVWKLLTGEKIRPQSVSFFDWLQGKYISIDDFNTYKLKQEELNKAQNERIFNLEKYLGMTRGYE